MNPLLVKLLVAFAPSIEQLIASLLSHWIKGGKRVLDPKRSAAKIVEAAETAATILTEPTSDTTVEKSALAAWAREQPTPKAFDDKKA